jgi:hypothetical protein
MTPKLNPEEAWQALDQLVDEEKAAERDEVDALEGPELDRELKGRGLKPEALRAHARDAIRKVAASRKGEVGKRAKVIPLRPGVTRLWARVAAAAAVLAPVGFAALAEIEPYALVGSAQDAGTDLLEAKSLREKAASALQAGQASRCLVLLDAAKELDPEGDREPDVMRARRTAMEKLGLGDGAPLP